MSYDLCQINIKHFMYGRWEPPQLCFAKAVTKWNISSLFPMTLIDV